MSADWFDLLWRWNGLLSLAIIAVLILRWPLRRVFGAQIACRTWWLVPAIGLVSLLPSPTAPPIWVEAGVGSAVTGSGQWLERMAPTNDWQGVVLVVWLLGAAVAAALAVHRQRRFRQRLGALMATSDGYVQAASLRGGNPFVLGVWQPRIVVPVDIESRHDAGGLALILAHERAHVARRDPMVLLIAECLCSLFWFNPLVHLAQWALRRDQELACDARALSGRAGWRRRYAETLLRAANSGEAAAGPCAWIGHGDLRQRIVQLQRTPPGPVRRTLGVLSLVTLITVGMGAAWASGSRSAEWPVATQETYVIDASISLATDVIRRTDIIAVPGRLVERSWPTDGGELRVAFTLRPADGDLVDIEARIRHGERLLGAPSLRVREGVAAQVRVGDGTQHVYRLDVRVDRQPMLDGSVTRLKLVDGSMVTVTCNGQPRAVGFDDETGPDVERRLHCAPFEQPDPGD